jgi:hypothetical protein
VLHPHSRARRAMEPKGQLLQGSELTERRMPPPLGTTPKRSALKRSALPNAAPLAPLTVERPLGGTLSGPASARASSDEIEQSEDVRINRKLSWHDHHGTHPPCLNPTRAHKLPL